MGISILNFSEIQSTVLDKVQITTNNKELADKILTMFIASAVLLHKAATVDTNATIRFDFHQI
jgi:hypothetical protein